ncbi:aldehyde dehydrogenase family protein [Oceanimonas sp. NS1]|nr:aldehyde dehydrogenase family protein [Oceanimonas sp. NS1]
MTLSVAWAIGVVAAITPWNSPIASEMQKIAPALAGVQRVLLKPADATPRWRRWAGQTVRGGRPAQGTA